LSVNVSGKIELWNSVSAKKLNEIVTEDPLFAIDYHPRAKIFAVGGQQ
jgi:hypothetical protein